MATVTEVIAAGRRDILALEPDILADLLRMYDDAWRFTERQIARYESQIAQAVAESVEPKPSWLRQQVWYRQLQASIDAEMSHFQTEALRTIAHGQQQAVGIAAETATGFTGAVGISPGIVARVNAGAFERWVSALRPDSPIRQVMGKYGPRVEDALLRHITDGIGTGQGVSNIIRNVRREVGTDITAGRLQTVARTEVHRAMRGASADTFAAMPKGVITGYRWISAKDRRTCILCLAKDGTVTETYPTNQHVSCRCTVSPVVSDKYLPPRGRPRETGREWFEKQPESVKRSIMPTEKHFELYRAGMPITEFVGVKRSRTWGDSIVLRPASALEA